ncbi:MAG: hypothetical protein ACXV49_08365, partial [Halobacteriota archaeon]
VHSKKSPYTYPVIRLPREFRKQVGAAATVFETTFDGALAFLVVPHSRESGELSTGSDNQKSPLHGGDREFESLRAHSFFGELWLI